MERELMLTGIGGQGIQLAAQLLASAAVADARHVLMFGSYGGMMRGGNTDATLVIADAPVQSPPTVGATWSALVMHHAYMAPTLDRLRPDGLLVVNETVVDAAALDTATTHPDGPVLRVPASRLAIELGNQSVATMVALGAYLAATGIAPLDTVVATLPEVLPSYRARHVEVNARALHAGAALVPAPVLTAWPEPVGAR